MKSSRVLALGAACAFSANATTIVAEQPLQLKAPENVSVLINGQSYGHAWVRLTNQANVLLLQKSVADESNLSCNQTHLIHQPDAEPIELCQALVRALIIERNGVPGGLVRVDAGPDSFNRDQDRNIYSNDGVIAEERRVRASFLNYNVFTSFLDDERFVAVAPHFAFRDADYGFDIAGTFQEKRGAEGTSSFDSSLGVAALRRSWFHDRLYLSLGRIYTSPSGFVGGSSINGISVSRRNIDAQGNALMSFSSRIEGFAPMGGVLLYRVGGSVYREVPIAPGPYSIDPAAFSGLPAGGSIEFHGPDGTVRDHHLNIGSSQITRIYERGAYDWDVALGEENGGSHLKKLWLGGRYGVTEDATVHAEGEFSADTAIFQGGIALRLPRKAGDLEMTYAAATSDDSAALSVDYSADVGDLRVSANHRQHFGAHGVGSDVPLGGLNASQPLYTKLLRKSSAASFGAPLPGRWGSLNARASILSYDGLGTTKSAELQISLPIFASLNLTAAINANQASGQAWTSGGYIMINMPFGQQQASLHTSFERVRRNDWRGRTQANLSGVRNTEWDSEESYSLSANDDGAISGYWNKRFSAATVSGSLSHNSAAGTVSGFGSLSGAAVLYAGSVIPAQRVDDSVVIVHAAEPSLQGALVSQEGAGSPIARLNSNGYAVVGSGLRYYKSNRIIIDKDLLPLALELEPRLARGTFHPAAAYLLEAKSRFVTAARLHLVVDRKIPPESVFAAGSYLSPVEDDGTVYVEDEQVLQSGVWELRTPTATYRCVRPAGWEVSAAPGKENRDPVRTVERVVCN